MDRDSIIRLLEFLNEENQEPFVFHYQEYFFRKQVGKEFPQKDKRVIFSVDYFAGGTKMLILIDFLMGKLRIQYFHEKEVKQCLFDAVNQFKEAYLNLVYSEWMK